MAIRVQTAAGWDIPNGRITEIDQVTRNYSADIPLQHPQAKVLGPLSGTYNCHGLTFASRRTRIPEPSDIQRILVDDKYAPVQRDQARVGDIVVYRNDGEISHTGIVVANDPPLFVPLIWSKWGSGPEVLHQYHDVHELYGKHYEFMRCSL